MEQFNPRGSLKPLIGTVIAAAIFLWWFYATPSQSWVLFINPLNGSTHRAGTFGSKEACQASLSQATRATGGERTEWYEYSGNNFYYALCIPVEKP
mgnify:FL=1|jgi:hypothetical protein